MDNVMPLFARDHIKGNKKAPVNILEYGDYECPFCGKAYYVIDRLLKEDAAILSYSFRNFPLINIHPNALPAALAAEAAALQDKFWQMYTVLYENQSLLDGEYILAYAQKIGLDVKKFIRDMDADEVVSRVEEDLLSGEENGVNSTPTFFLNGELYTGPYDYGILSAVIDHIAQGTKYKKIKDNYKLNRSRQ
jgi:protein-disulfide isomerase